jgi:hypothetical protein
LKGNSQNQETRKMIVASYHSFTPLLSPFTEAKNRDNMDCFILSIDSGTNFQTIKQKIDSVYTIFPADFLLLIGDYQHIPSFHVEEGLSDIHYTFENESLPVPRMAVGRFSVENEQDLQTMINRSITRKPSSKHVVGIASQEISELTQLYDYEQIRIMGNTMLENSFLKSSELFDGSQGGNDKDGNPTYKDILEVLNTGTTCVNYAGYGSYEGWNTGSFENHHIDSLNDNIELPIIISASCLGGHFANRTCFAEKWMRSAKNGNPIGAAAVIMPSSLADWDASLSAMIIMSQNISIDSNHRLGDLYLSGYHHIIHEMQRPKDAYCWVLFGDPSLWIFFKENENETNLTQIETSNSSFAFPNPASSVLTISKDGHFYMYDIFGKKVLYQYINFPNYNLDIADIPAGMYIISLENNNRKYIQKLIVE